MEMARSATPVPGKGRRRECSGECALLFHSDSIALLWSRPNLPLPISHPFVAGEFFQTHRTTRADLVRADANLGAHAEFAAVSEARGRIPIHGRRINLL